MIETYVLVSSPQALTWTSYLRLWRIYKDFKKRAQKGAGSALARALAAGGGRGICDRLNYCQHKAQLKELFDFADSPEGKKLFAEGVAAAMESKWKEYIELLHKVLGEAADAIAEVTKEMVEGAADSAIPISFVFMSVKYGLDDLCACCADCDGAGWIDSKECPACSGKGHFRPD
jgi:hypothetical protein